MAGSEEARRAAVRRVEARGRRAAAEGETGLDEYATGAGDPPPGSQVTFDTDSGPETGTVLRVWGHAPNLTIETGDGRTFVRRTDRVTPA